MNKIINEEYAAHTGTGFFLPAEGIREDASGAKAVSISTLALERGELNLVGEINSGSAQHLIMLLRYTAEQGLPVKLFISTPGGEVTAGLAIHDALDSYPYEVDIYCTGIAASMGAVILAGGRKGHRFITPHGKVMIHEPLIAGGFGGSATSIERTAQSILETKATLNSLLAEFTGKTVEEINDATAFDNFLSAEEAIDFGLCDAISTGF
ncbi:MAG: ATP-dependent Clp protease proteolytic subunit [Ruminococcus sp.]|nr:ATP-dependent Clp protease proteolytic subunit [Ruminococcus sp.]